MRLFIDSTELISNGVALLDRVQRDGYALLRGLLPRSLVLALRDTLAEHLKQAGWLDPTQPTSECIANPEGACVDPEPAYLEVLRWFYQRYEFHALSHCPEIAGLLDRMLADEILVHPRPLLRIVFPQLTEYTTPAHQDYLNMQGTEEVYTAWIPLLDCPKEVGG